MRRPDSTIVGLFFLFGGLALFAVGVAALAVWERARHAPARTVRAFRHTRVALGKIFRAQAARREAARARARAAHPAARGRRFRRSA